MKNALIFLAFLLITSQAFSQFGSATVQRIDEIKNNTTQDIKLNPVGDVVIGSGTPSTAVFLDGDKKLKSSPVTSTELGYLSGTTTTIQSQLDAKANASATVNLSGDQSISGEKTFTGKLITSSTGNGSIPCPAVDTTDRDAMTPDVGECVYNTDTLLLNLWNGSDWVNAGGGGISQWVTATDYKIDDVVIFSGEIYQALTDHTSGTFSTDLANGDWVKISDTFLFQGQNQSELNRKKLEAPNNQLTSTSPSSALLETNNKNLLSNPGFEHFTYSTGWTTSGTATYSAETSAPLAGLKSFKAVASAQTIDLLQDTTLYAAARAGSQMFWRFPASNTAAGVTACVRKNGVKQTGTNDCITLATDGVTRTYELAFLANDTSNGINIDAPSTTGTLLVDDVELSTDSSSFIDVAQIGPWIDYGVIPLTAVTSNPTKGTTTIDKVECRVNGQDYECRYQFINTGAGAAAGSGDYLIGLPVGVEVDENQYTAYTGTLSGTLQSARASFETTGGSVQGGANSGRLEAFYYGSNRFRLFLTAEFSSTGAWGSGYKAVTVSQEFFFTIKFRGKGLSNKVSTYSQACVRDVDCENVFSAKVSAAGVVSGENLDWINGNAAVSGTSIYTISFNSSIFTNAPVCVFSSGQINLALYTQNSVSSSQIVVQTYDQTSTVNPRAFEIICTKQGVDFKAKNVITGTFQDVVTSPGAGRPVLCSAKISSTGVISDQIGGCFASCTNANPRVCTFTSNYWSGVPTCQASSFQNSATQETTIWAHSSSSISVYTSSSTGANTQQAFNIVCHGIAQ